MAMMNGWTTFLFRFIRSTWGIAIDLRARAVELAAAPAGVRKLADRVYLDVSSAGLTDTDENELIRGFSTIAEQIGNAVGWNAILIEVSRLTYALTDYQSDGVAAAAIGWAAEYFDLDTPSVRITFDREGNRYIFDW